MREQQAEGDAVQLRIESEYQQCKAEMRERLLKLGGEEHSGQPARGRLVTPMYSRTI